MPQDDNDQAAGFLDHSFAALQQILPQHGLSALMHRLARSQRPYVKRGLINGFQKLIGVDLAEAEQTDRSAYPSFNAFFTRELKADARPIAIEGNSLVCPVDGAVSQAGAIDGDSLFQAKRASFTTAELLADEALAEQFHAGLYSTIYLSPKDYHRIHMPVTGQLKEMIYIPGKLFSVNSSTTRAIPKLFARNERVACVFDTALGPMVMVLVGAIFVGSIETVWHGEVTAPRLKSITRWSYTGAEAITLKAGAELGRFNMGSTIIMLLPAGSAELSDDLAPGKTVRMGQNIGRLTLASAKP